MQLGQRSAEYEETPSTLMFLKVFPNSFCFIKGNIVLLTEVTPLTPKRGCYESKLRFPSTLNNLWVCQACRCAADVYMKERNEKPDQDTPLLHRPVLQWPFCSWH